MNQPMRRADRSLSRDQALQIMKEADCHTLSLCDGHIPYGVTVSLAFVGERAYFHSAMEGYKCRIIGQATQVCVTCARDVRVLPQALSVAYRSATAFGTVSRVSDHAECVQALRAICDRYAPGEPKAEHVEECDRTAAVYRIDFTEITGKYNQD